MAWTKLQICEEAYAELMLAGYTFDLQPEELERAGRRLDLMMATWDAKGIHVGYNSSADPDTLDLAADSGLPLTAVEAVITNLALRLCPGEGKEPHPDTREKAKEGLDSLMAAAAIPSLQQMRGGMPLGAGNKGRGTFAPTPDLAPLQVSESGDLEFDDL